MGNNTDDFFLRKPSYENNTNIDDDTTDGIFLRNNNQNSTRIELSEISRKAVDSTRFSRFSKDSNEFLTAKKK
ncbi:hypothetical protein [Clostridium botulinum]|uniref:hypothetical protein n=1 Tax=Clostridium botulinum TaxID=1491 RepID=UPI0007736282|nr:hypothetical protein [Clostridium botulinum]NFN81856.1 hypothetical protein [Clostridium botulinum]